MANEERVKYLIIGNSAGGIGAAEAIREVDRTGAIAIVSDEAYPAYSRPLIAEYLGDRCSLEHMLYRTPGFYEANDIRTFLGRSVTGVDIAGRSVTLDDGSVITWERLLLATGGKPFAPPMEGGDGPGVFTFTTLDDAKSIDQALENGAARAVVIGGGLIGVSATEALTKRGIKVTIVEMMDRILGTILDEGASALEAAALEEAGVDILTGHTVAGVDRDSTGSVRGITLDDGTPVACDLVIVAIGVQPRSDLAAAAGLNVNRGIVVDRNMMTSAAGVYACGDVCEAFDFIHGENRVTPIWPNAYVGGRVAGFNMAGVPTEYEGGTTMNSMKYFGVVIHSAGVVVHSAGAAGSPDDGFRVICENRDGRYRKVVLRDGQVVGLVFAGDIERTGIVYSLMKDGVDVTAFAEELVADDFGLAALPEAIWRPRLEAPAGVGE